MLVYILHSHLFINKKFPGQLCFSSKLSARILFLYQQIFIAGLESTALLDAC